MVHLDLNGAAGASKADGSRAVYNDVSDLRPARPAVGPIQLLSIPSWRSVLA